MRFVRTFAATLMSLSLGFSAPLAAQDWSSTSSEEMSAEDMAAFGQMMGGMFAPEPLTEEQTARLPLANAVVSKMLPPGFYEELMGDVMGTTLRPILSMFSGPEMIVMSSVSLDQGLPELSDGEWAELAETLDPAYATRTDTMIAAMTSGMGEMFAVMEGPMREGMARAYVTRFTTRQLEEIGAFFDTPTGALYARESMAMAADPQFMSSIMGSMPQMMGQMGDFEATMEAAMANVPEAKTFDQLSGGEREKAARLLGISVEQLRAGMAAAAEAKDADETMEYEGE